MDMSVANGLATIHVQVSWLVIGVVVLLVLMFLKKR